MFNAATPPAARRPRGAAGGAKPKTTTPSNQDLPYISPMASSAYGSKATNVPKPPRLSDTRVRLAEGMQAKENEMNARLKAELEKREQEEAAARAIAERNQPPTVVPSLPPPSPARTTRASSRETRERTVEDTTIEVQPELSTLSAIDNSATFASPFVIDQAVGSKVVEQTPDFDNDMGEPDMSYLHESLPTPAPEAHYSSIDKGSKARSTGYQSLTPAQSFDTAPSPRRSTRNRVVKPDPQSRGRRVKKDLETGMTMRRPRRHTAPIDAYDADATAPTALDKFFRWYHSQSRWLAPMVFFLIVAALSTLVGVHYIMGHMDRHSFDGPYNPPNTPVTNIQHLVDRLFELEQNLGTVDSRLSNKFHEGITDLKSALSKASSDSSSAASMSEKTSKETASLLRSLQAQLDDLQRSTLSYRRSMSEELRKAQEAAKAAGKQPTDILGPRQIREEVTNAVKAALPTSLAATVKPDGSVEISDTFKIALRDLFNTFFPRHFSQELKKANLDSIRAVPSWQTFIAENEERLRTTIDDRVESAIKNQKPAEPVVPAGAVLTSETVMAMVVDNLEEYQRNWEKTTLYPILEKHFTSFKSSLEKDQNARLDNLQSSINRAQATLVQSAAAAASSVASQVARKVSATTTTKGAGAQAAGIQIPDYANKITGAAVWPYLTSPSWEFGSKRNSLSSLWGKLLPGLESRHAPSPVIALLPTTDVGDCWPFPGGYGTLAVRLSKEIYPTHFTIEHAPKLLAPDFTSAPKVVEFWVQIKNATERALVESRAAALAEKSGKPYAMERIMAPGPPESNDAVYRVDKNSREFVKVDTAIYEGGAEDGVESFELSTDFQQMGVKTGIVAVVVRENWGNEEFTCLYRVRVHGFTPGEEKEEKKGWW
ncbi:Similar to Spindle pole body-associated protein sad1; acc. no. Q09825 [Pyronema omphalodes CBS 100304]|uniref:Similar to Spindle pole body-associated protein sad1 acc. no. Q09825 n=1 Tax=Pyronema omphalodes (strain CBS 100304) TaxID=1076935 RepID=U4KYP3_PYROM|nr:Similar to Spindle pole body-associated protein sad1; acc. no. Q09825 [Pyronema omphalodes CBS 100304]